jgi:pyrroline-5-carboxylate reductase
MTQSLKVGFLGLGRMGAALARGCLNSAVADAVSGYDPAAPANAEATLPGLIRAQSAADLEAAVDVVLLCVKPQDMPAAIAELAGNKRYISIAAGLSTGRLRSFFKTGQSTQISRVMPNISATIGQSVSGYYCEEETLAALTERLFSAVGVAIRVKQESLLHAVTGLSGSGPAYVFEFIHALAEGGVAAGLPYEAALKLAVATTAGAAALVTATGEHPSALRNHVASPGGTTIAGLAALERGAFHGQVMAAVDAATRRSRELDED